MSAFAALRTVAILGATGWIGSFAVAGCRQLNVSCQPKAGTATISQEISVFRPMYNQAILAFGGKFRAFIFEDFLESTVILA